MSRYLVVVILSALGAIFPMAESQKDKYAALTKPCQRTVVNQTSANNECPESENPANSIIPPKLVKKEMPNNMNGCSMNGRMLYEVLINEKGGVACVQLLKMTNESEKCALRFAEAIRKWQYKPALNDKGEPVEAYSIITINTK